MQVDPMKLKLKPPGTKRLQLKYHILLSNYAFKFNMRRYTKVILRGMGDRAHEGSAVRAAAAGAMGALVASPGGGGAWLAPLSSTKGASTAGEEALSGLLRLLEVGTSK